MALCFEKVGFDRGRRSVTAAVVVRMPPRAAATTALKWWHNAMRAGAARAKPVGKWTKGKASHSTSKRQASHFVGEKTGKPHCRKKDRQATHLPAAESRM